MPHITIRAYPGHSEEEKKELANAIADDVVRCFSVPREAVSVSIAEVSQENWKRDVWDTEMHGPGMRLLVEPGYKMD
ncbi:MAG: tautomerase family protein [Oscillospiraceae bacterium]|jgi:4-oxalocrotonate tautomerase